MTDKVSSKMIVTRRRVINTKGESSPWEFVAPTAFDRANAEYKGVLSATQEKTEIEIKTEIETKTETEKETETETQTEKEDNIKMVQIMQQRFEEALYNEWSSPQFWERREEILEKQREKYNKKSSWSADDIVEVNRIDKELQECDSHIRDLYIFQNEQDRHEYEYD